MAKSRWSLPGAVVLACSVAACNSTPQSLITGTALASVSVGSDLEQTYFLGVFDPQEQLPPTLYRVRVRGQASVLSGTEYASGWVPAEFVDSLNTKLSFGMDEARELKAQRHASVPDGQLAVGRRLMLFGPEGFREAPGDQRLAIVMGASPEDFFDAVNQTLGEIGDARLKEASEQEQLALATLIQDARHSTQRLEDLHADLDYEVTRLGGGE